MDSDQVKVQSLMVALYYHLGVLTTCQGLPAKKYQVWDWMQSSLTESFSIFSQHLAVVRDHKQEEIELYYTWVTEHFDIFSL